MSITINLRDYYPHYTHDEFVEVSEEVAVELRNDKKYHKVHDRRMKRNKAYSFDVDADMETAAMACSSNNPEVIFEMIELQCNLCRALNALPEIQGRRVDARYLQGKSIQEIAIAEGVSESSVKESIARGLSAMKNNFQSCPAICP